MIVTRMKKRRRGYCSCCARYHQAGKDCLCPCSVTHATKDVYPDVKALEIRKKYA